MTTSPNQNPEQQARDEIDSQLEKCGWIVQDYRKINLHAGAGVAVREYPVPDVGRVDYALFVNEKPVGVIEAKKAVEGQHLTVHEDQVEDYAETGLKYHEQCKLPFIYLSTGQITRFSDGRDPNPRFREVFTFHRPETLAACLQKKESLRMALQALPELETEGLRECQITAINNLEGSFRQGRPRALIQMATGSGKTYTAITFVYRLLKYARTGRILFLVDTKNLGEQAEQEFMAYHPADDNRGFSELYAVQRLKSRHIPDNNHVYISTIQRLYAVLKGQELEESAEEENPNERWQPKEPQPVVYNEKLPIGFFDFIVIDECHRSIYNLWRQVLDYFDAFQIGLTATPDSRAVAYFHENLVSEYSHELAVADGVNVGYDVFIIETKITKKGATLKKGRWIETRERLTRRKRFEEQDEDEAYSGKQLDRDVVNPSQIRTVIKGFRGILPVLFPDRYDRDKQFEVPKTLVFAKTDSHADDIIQMVREEFGEGNRFCKKVTYRADEDPKSVLASFRNDYYPRIAVTVDMIATGTDVKPLECLLFMRDVRSRNYFEQMKGRGTRVIDFDDLKKVSPTAKRAKDHFVIVDAVGVTESLKTVSRPLEKNPGVPLKELLQAVAVCARDEALFTSLANRLARLDRQLSDSERAAFADKTGGITLAQAAKGLLEAFDPDRLESLRNQAENELPGASQAEIDVRAAALIEDMQSAAARPFTGETREHIEDIRRRHEQKIDTENIDSISDLGWKEEVAKKANDTVNAFTEWVESSRDEITALRIFYGEPHRRRDLTFTMIRDVVDRLKADRPRLAPLEVWAAYEKLEAVTGSPKNELTALVALLRRVAGIDSVLTPFERTVDANFKKWIFKRHEGAGQKFNEDQMKWLNMLKEYIASSIHVAKEDLSLAPFNAHGGLGMMYKLFGEEMYGLMDELNGAMVG